MKKPQALTTLTWYSLFNQITDFKNILQNGNSYYDTQTKEVTRHFLESAKQTNAVQ